MKIVKLDNFTKSQKPWEVEGVEWREVKLKEIVEDIKSGFALSKQKRRKIDANNGIPQLRPYNIANWNKINFDELTYIPENMQGIDEYFIENGDVLFNNTNSIELVGRAVVYKELDGNYTYSNHITRIRVKKQIITPDFLSWYLNFLWNKGFFYLKATKWIGQAGISNKKLLSIKIPLPFRNGKPDLETQKKIVEYIEANFSRIDAILEKKKKELEQLDELWESVLEQAFKPKEGEEWREVRLGDLVKEKPRYGLTTKAKDKGKFVFLRITDIDDQGEIKNNNFKFVDLDESQKAKYDIRKGDLLLARSGSVGNFFIAFQDYPNWIYASYLIRFRLDISKVHLMFVRYYLSSQYFKKWVSFQKRPGAQPNINAKEYSSFKIPIPFRNNQPDIEKQKEIANYLDSVYEKIKALKEKIQNQITQLEEMKESILDEVFNHDEAK